MKLSIIIPVYNEKKSILTVLDKIEKVSLGNISKEVIIIDDGSTDGTRELLKNIGKGYKIFLNSQNRGKGYSVREGLKHATGDFIIFQDGDLEYNPEDYQKLLDTAMNNRGCVVYGDRIHNTHPDGYTALYLGNLFLSSAVSLIYRQKMNDMETCYKLFPSKIIKDLDLAANRFDIEPEITAKLLKKKVKVIEVPIQYKGRLYNEGKKISWKDGVIALFVLIKYKFSLNVFTRGFGLLEGYLSKKRARMANKLIPSKKRSGRILDIGCGTRPYFLLNTRFKEKYGIDPSAKLMSKGNLKVMGFDIKKRFPFKDNFFDVITMLAVIEHIEPSDLPKVLSEIRRVLKKGGRFILTTPCAWTDSLLEFMAKLRLISPEEFEEHKREYSHRSIRICLSKAGFDIKKARLGYFEMFLNNWAYVDK